MFIRRFVNLLALLVLVSLSCNFAQSLNSPGDNSATPNRALLNEVLFLPASGAAAFIELKSSGGRISLNGLTLVNERGESYSLPEGLDDLASDQFLLILFDGSNLVEDKTVHADLSGFLSPGSGFIELRAADGSLLDRAAWGPDLPASVKLDRGGVISSLEPGTTIGRLPRSVNPNPLEWTIFHPQQATPGVANPQPGVEIMIPLNGARISQTSFGLSWYPVPGATQYHVQVSSDDTFSTLIVDETVSTGSLNVNLQPGKYFWRVQAITDAGQADYSPVQTLTVNSGSSGAGHLATPRRETVLRVPLIMQHKDTAMLLLESQNETGNHAWDAAHPDLDTYDPADNMNCALASIDMISTFFNASISQDRIGYEVFKDRWRGPEEDLNYGDGLFDDQITMALNWALGGSTLRPAPASLDVIWGDIQQEIDAQRPILATVPGHAIVITGYGEDSGGRYVTINDPWWGSYAVNLDSKTWKTYWLAPASPALVSEEAEIYMDSDGDGVVDFDETQRFGTDPYSDDSDKDNVKDKEDIRSGVFDENYGYAFYGFFSIGRDYDNDGIATEKDEDSDDGGCFDGIEDFDLDGKFKAPETYNFEEGDDACFWGTHEIYLESNYVTSDGNHHQQIRTFIKFSLHAIENGKLEGLAQITYTHTGEFNYPECSGTHTIGTQYYQAELRGDFQKLPDGGTFVGFQASPSHGPPYMIHWVSSCPVEDEQQEGWTWGGMGGTLRDGVYDYFADTSFGTDTLWQKIHMEQGQGQ